MEVVWKGLTFTNCGSSIVSSEVSCWPCRFSYFSFHNRGSRLKRKYLHLWKVAYEKTLRHSNFQMKSVEKGGNRCCLSYYLKIWKAFIEQRRLDNEINLRAEQQWNMVQSWMRK
jgi:hypothetical protein